MGTNRLVINLFIWGENKAYEQASCRSNHNAGVSPGFILKLTFLSFWVKRRFAGQSRNSRLSDFSLPSEYNLIVQ